MKLIYYILLILVAIFAVNTTASAQLKDQEKLELMTLAQNSYKVYGLEGPQVFKIHKKYALVDIEKVVSKMNSMAQSRSAEIKATRNIIEYLSGTTNKAVSVYSHNSEESHNFNDASMENAHGNIYGKTNENEISVETEKMDEETVQKSQKKIKGVQALCAFKGTEGEQVYMFYVLLYHSSAKKKN